MCLNHLIQLTRDTLIEVYFECQGKIPFFKGHLRSIIMEHDALKDHTFNKPRHAFIPKRLAAGLGNKKYVIFHI